jgi:N utilization substance protein A
MNYEILEALSQINKNKNIDMDFVIESLEAGLMLAAKKKFGNADNIKIDVDRKSGEIRITASKTVVRQVTDPNLEITLAEAKKMHPEAKHKSEVEVEIGFEEFGRNAILAG